MRKIKVLSQSPAYFYKNYNGMFIAFLRPHNLTDEGCEDIIDKLFNIIKERKNDLFAEQVVEDAQIANDHKDLIKESLYVFMQRPLIEATNVYSLFKEKHMEVHYNHEVVFQLEIKDNNHQFLISVFVALILIFSYYYCNFKLYPNKEQTTPAACKTNNVNKVKKVLTDRKLHTMEKNSQTKKLINNKKIVKQMTKNKHTTSMSFNSTLARSQRKNIKDMTGRTASNKNSLSIYQHLNGFDEVEFNKYKQKGDELYSAFFSSRDEAKGRKALEYYNKALEIKKDNSISRRLSVLIKYITI